MDKFEQHIKRMKGLRDVYEVGTGQHNILSMLIMECEIALRQPPVVGRSEQCAHEFKVDDKSEIPFDLICQKCGKKS
jgi:hypothetical protein